MLKKILFAGLSLFLFSIALITSVTAAPKGVAAIDMSGEINGAPYRIRVPDNWNGTLLVYVHGYRDKADHPGEVDNRTADIAPSPALEPVFLGQGFALAGSAFRDNGWAVEEGIQDTKNLADFFRFHVAPPNRIILWGFSMGSVISFRSMERFGNLYNGALCGCAVGAGTTRSWDFSGDLSLAYDVAFGFSPQWGTVGNVRDDLDFDTEVAPKLLTEVNNSANFPLFELIRLVVGTPGRGVMPPPPPNFYPNWIFTDLFFATEARAELERRAGGPIVQNLNRLYTVSAAERGYLNAIGLNNASIDLFLAQMNARRNLNAPHLPRFYLQRNADYTGVIRNPVLTMHTLIDPLVPVSHENQYFQTVNAVGHASLLFQTYTDGNGHCNFTGPQLVTAVNAINSWVITGTRPTQANFPAAIGFLPDFVPPPLNQP